MGGMGATGGSGDDEAAWRAAIEGVRPIERRADRLPPPERPRMDRLAPAGVLRFRWHREPDGYVEVFREGSLRSVLESVLHEPIEVDASIDLHGMRRREAAEALARFLREQHAKGHRSLLVIHGRGLHRKDGRAELPAVCHRVLTEEAVSHLVLAFASAPRRLGGIGALVVRLR